MNRFGWFMALLLVAFVAGCGGGDDGGAPAGVRTCEGPDCVALGTASNFAILTSDGIIDNGPSVITGDVGVSGASGITNTTTCAEVTGTVFDTDAAYAGGTPCLVTDADRLSKAETDIGIAFADADARTSTVPLPPAGTTDFGPGVYTFPGSIAVDTNITLTGGPTAVWIFQVPGDLTVDPAMTVTVAGGAKAKNVFWRIGGNVGLGAGARLDGIVLASGAVIAEAGATVTGRLYSASIATLDTTTVAHPAP